MGRNRPTEASDALLCKAQGSEGNPGGVEGADFLAPVAVGFEVGAGKAIDGEEDERRHMSDCAGKRAAIVEHVERFAALAAVSRRARIGSVELVTGWR